MEKLISNGAVGFGITENCSFQCDHCMRGDRRPNTMSKEVIDVFLSQIDIRGIVHLCGGEPLMRSKLLSYLINQIYEQGNNPEWFSVITNGSVSVKKVEEFIKPLSEKEVDVSITISNDYYHKIERMRLNKGIDNINKVFDDDAALFCSYGFDPYHFGALSLADYKPFTNGKGVSSIGKGANIKGARECHRNFDLSHWVRIENDVIKGHFEIQADGTVTSPVDMSWEEKDYYYGPEYNIMNRSLRKILTR